MQKSPLLMWAVSAALMVGALVFGLYPDRQAQMTEALAPNQQALQRVILDYQGKTEGRSNAANPIYIAVR